MKKRNRGGALLLVLLLTLGGAWPAYAAEPETPPPAATEESGLPEGGLPAPEPEEPPQPAPMISAVVTGFAGDGLPALPAVTLPVRQTGNSDDDLEPLYRLAVQQQSVTALVTAGEESRQEPLGVAWDFGDIDQNQDRDLSGGGTDRAARGLRPRRGCAGGTVHPGHGGGSVPGGHHRSGILVPLYRRICPAPGQCFGGFGGEILLLPLYPPMRNGEWENRDRRHRVGLLRRGIPDRGGLSGGGHGAPAGKHGLWGWACSAPDHRSCLRPAAGQAGTQLPSGRTGALVFPWVAPPGDLAAVRRMAVGGWRAVEEITDGACWDETQLSLFTDLLNTGCHYRIQADYDGGQTGILSFLYADEIVLEGYHDGDRDGGDTGGNPPQDIVQPPADTGDDRTDAAPEPWEPEEDDLPRRPETPEEDRGFKTGALSEPVTETKACLCRARVLTMARGAGGAFPSQGVTLIPV